MSKPDQTKLRFTDLQPQFMGFPIENRLPHVESIEEARGVMFLCPVCFVKNLGPRGTHSVICWAPDVPQNFEPKPGRWSLHGIGLENLTLKGSTSDSVHLKKGDWVVQGCNAHFFVTDGMVTIV